MASAATATETFTIQSERGGKGHEAGVLHIAFIVEFFDCIHWECSKKETRSCKVHNDHMQTRRSTKLSTGMTRDDDETGSPNRQRRLMDSDESPPHPFNLVTNCTIFLVQRRSALSSISSIHVGTCRIRTLPSKDQWIHSLSSKLQRRFSSLFCPPNTTQNARRCTCGTVQRPSV